MIATGFLFLLHFVAYLVSLEIEVYVECLEAQSLLRAGTIPGAGPGRVPQLGFHLASCPACRAFRQVETLARIPVVGPAKRGLSFLRRMRNRPLPVAACIVLLLGAMAGWYIGLPLVRAWSDIAAMTSLATSAQDSFNSSPPDFITSRSETAALERRGLVSEPLQAIVAPTSAKPQNASISKVSEPALAKSVAKSTPPGEDNALDTGSPDTLRVATAGPAGLAVQADRRLALWDKDEEPPAPSATSAAPLSVTGAVTILVLGLDARQGEGPLARSDAIMVVRLDVDTQKVALLSLPRDLWVPISGFGEGKIDSAYFLGELTGEGAAVATRTVSQVLGIEIDRTAVVNFDGFRSLIDAVGGITIDVPTELYDANFPTDDYGYTVVHFESGPQKMDGERALIYSRIRHPDSDFERARRQQSVVLAIAQKLRARGVLRNLHDADRLTTAVRPFMHTDLPRAMALNLLWSMRSADVSNVERITIDTSQLSESNIGGAYALIAEPSVLQSLGVQLIAGE